jgi:magnesium transporter
MARVTPATTASLLVAAVPRAAPAQRAADVRDTLLAGAFGSAGEVVVLDGDRLVGLAPLEAVLSAPAETPLRELLRPEPAVVRDDVDRERAAALAARHGGRAVAVVDRDDRFVGLVPPEALIAVLFEEHEEDLARLSGSLARTSAARSASEEAVSRRLWHRLPWLLVGLAGAMASTVVVAAFEEQLRRELLLAIFVPAVVYMADAVGTQTETVVIRGMSLGIPIRRVALREVLTGLVIGALIASSFFVFAGLVWHDLRIAAIVSLALLVSTAVATAVAMCLPALLARLGQDPAYGSGPLATVIQDLLSIAVYLSIAVALT